MFDSSKTGDLFLTVDKELGRHQTDNMLSWVQQEAQSDDGFILIATRIKTKSLLEEEQVSWDSSVLTIKLQLINITTSTENKDGDSLEIPLDKKDTFTSWQSAISTHQEKGTKVFYSDSSLDNEKVGAGWYGSVFSGGSISCFDFVGERAIVWDSKIRGISGALQYTTQEPNILILAESHAVLATVKKAGTTGKARTKELANVIWLLYKRDSAICECSQGDQIGDHIRFECTELKQIRKGWKS